MGAWRVIAATVAAVIGTLGLPGATLAAASLTVVGGVGERTVSFVRLADRSLAGSLTVQVRNDAKKAKLGARYVPEAGPAAGGAKVSLAIRQGGQPLAQAPPLGANRIGTLRLTFGLPADASPSAADGTLSMRLGAGSPVTIPIKGTGAKLPGVAFQPQKLTLQMEDWTGKFGTAPAGDATVELIGPGVPALFGPGLASPSPELLVRGSTGYDGWLTLEDLERRSAVVATARVRMSGDLQAGSYEAKLPLSGLSPDAPVLDVEVLVKDAFYWAIVAVLLGALFALAIFLFTGINRRKAVLQMNLKRVLERYDDKRAELADYVAQNPPPQGLAAADSGPEGERPLLLWALTGLGERQSWFKRRRDAVPEIDGVSGIWSNIAFARSMPDLDDDEHRVAELAQRIVRWLDAVPYVKALDKTRRRLHEPASEHVWDVLKTPQKTTRLLKKARREPRDAAAQVELIAELELQQRWHEVLGALWDAIAAIYADMATNGTSYSGSARTELKGLMTKLEALDGKASADSEDADDYSGYESEAEALGAKLRYIASQHRVTLPGALAASVLQADGIDRAQAPAVVDRESAVEHYERNAIRSGPEAFPAERPGRGSTYGRVFVSDLLWTSLIALLAAVVYIVPFYDSTWGTWSDYGTAFAAGFLGKIGLDWAATPVFQSLRLGTKRVVAQVKAPPKPDAAPGPEAKPEPDAKAQPEAATAPVSA
jgi:hypothetical protein